jgi:hypothetical protein
MVSLVDFLPPVFVEAAFFVPAAVEVFFAVLDMVFEMLSFSSSLAEAAMSSSSSLVPLLSSSSPSSSLSSLLSVI